MSKRLQHREGNGRWRETTLERDFGLRTAVCPGCGAFNPYGREVDDGPFPSPFGPWDRPEKCSQCDGQLPPK